MSQENNRIEYRIVYSNLDNLEDDPNVFNIKRTKNEVSFSMFYHGGPWYPIYKYKCTIIDNKLIIYE